MLVHMAPREVAGLQSLAMAHGGSLTINPTTGLPEAGFLSNLLPTLIGAGLSVASGGALTPLMAAGITGAGYGVATGSLQKGLMAGLGAYGGAGLGSGLSAAGAAEASVPGAAPVAPEATAAFTTEPSAYSKFAPTEAFEGAFGEAKGALTSTPTISHSMLDASGLPLNSPLAGPPMSFETVAPAPTTPLATPTPTVTPAPSSYTPGYGTESARNAFQSQAADATMTDNFKQAGRGLKSLVDSPVGRDAFLGNAAKEGVEATGVGGLGGLARYGSAAATPMLLDQRTGNGYKPDTEQYKYAYDLNRNPDPQGSYTGASTGERQWFAPKFRRLYAEGGQTKSSEDAQKYVMSADPTGRTNDLTGASRQAYDYLMGNGPGYRPQIQTQSSLPAARILPVEGGGDGGGGGGGASSFMGGASVGNTSDPEPNPIYDYTEPPAPVYDYTEPPAPVYDYTEPPAPVYDYTEPPAPVYDYVEPPAPVYDYTEPPAPVYDYTEPPAPVYDYVEPPAPVYDYDSAYVPANPSDFGAVDNTGGDFGDSGSYDGFIGDDDNIDEDRYDYAGNANGGLMGYAMGGMPGYATGGISNLGSYSDGGRLLKGPGDGVSDSIPAMIGKKQPARLADGEFVIPARIVSELGNGSTEAGARKLYQMMDRIQAARKKTTGKNRVAVNSRADKMMPV
jgi:hypothetical protein